MDEQPSRDEQAAFETRAVLAPGRGPRSRLALLLPVVALVGLAVAGLAGTRPANPIADAPARTSPSNAASTLQAAGSPPVAAAPRYPPRVLGLAVQGLGDVQLARLNRDDVVAISGWFMTLAITACPPIAATFQGNPQAVHPGFDPSAYCERSGVLYASPPDADGQMLPASPGAGDASIEVASVDARVVSGVVFPSELQVTGGDPTPVVIVGRFVESSSACMLLGACPSQLVVDYLAWSSQQANAGG